jgi:biopolymer transport protein ExbD
MKRRWRSAPAESELDITSFMNLMIILVPVLLMSMVFSRISVLQLHLPNSGQAGQSSLKSTIELVIREQYLEVYFPQDVLLKRIEKNDEIHDFAALSNVLQQLKSELKQRDSDRDDILILAERGTDYQTLVATMDATQSYPEVVAASVVDAELFPRISLGDAPQLDPSDQLTATP